MSNHSLNQLLEEIGEDSVINGELSAEMMIKMLNERGYFIRQHRGARPKDIVERVAKAIWQGYAPWDHCTEEHKEYWRGIAKSAIDAIGDTSARKDEDDKV